MAGYTVEKDGDGGWTVRNPEGQVWDWQVGSHAAAVAVADYRNAGNPEGDLNWREIMDWYDVKERYLVRSQAERKVRALEDVAQQLYEIRLALVGR